MCMLFFHAKKLHVPGKFRVVIISNRDEYFRRPTMPGHFWKENPMIFGGRDLKAEDEGGTWLAVNKTGRLSVLLNLTSGNNAKDARSRGHLVSDFVTQQDVTGTHYQQQVAKHATQHNPFHLVTMEILPETVRILYVARLLSGDVMGPVDLSPNPQMTQALGNSPINAPYQKTRQGGEMFQKVLDEHDHTDHRDQLISSLFEFAKTRTRFWPDPVLAQHTHLEPHLENFSSIFVNVPQMGYGTRTHTVILVDDQGRVDVIENTMQMEDGQGTDKWHETRETFYLTS